MRPARTPRVHDGVLRQGHLGLLMVSQGDDRCRTGVKGPLVDGTDEHPRAIRTECQQQRSDARIRGDARGRVSDGGAAPVLLEPVLLEPLLAESVLLEPLPV